MITDFEGVNYSPLDNENEINIQYQQKDKHGKSIRYLIILLILLAVLGLVGIALCIRFTLKGQFSNENNSTTHTPNFSNFLPPSELVQPEQIHVSLGKTYSEMYIHWITTKPTAHSIVQFGLHGLNNYENGNISEFIDGGFSKRKLYTHIVLLENLRESSIYFFHCGSFSGWSKTLNFRTIPSGHTWSTNILVYGDMGIEEVHALPSIKKDALSGEYDLIFHIGDMAYDMADEEGRKADKFMYQIEEFASYIPYMTSPGNHENHYNFSNYKARFPMMGSDGMYYSYNLGFSLIISISTEVYFYTPEQILSQRNWLLKELAMANLPKNRKRYPWIIILGHRPMYCTNNDQDDCTTRFGILRNDLEQILYDYGVDLAIWAHEHSYERLWPLYNMSICNGDMSPYSNPKAPVHIITGSVGSRHGHDTFGRDHAWSAYRSQDWGYARMKIFNTSHLYIEQVSVDMGGKIEDFVWLIKDKHEMNMYDCHLRSNPSWKNKYDFRF